MQKILATDLDGTFFYPKRRFLMISNKKVKLVRRWIDEGNTLILITGRSANSAKRVLKRIKRDVTLICCNGTYAYEHGEKIMTKPIDSKSINEVVEVLDNKFDPVNYILFTEKHNLVMYLRRVKFFTALLYPFWSIGEVRYMEPFVISKRVFKKELASGDIYKLMVVLGLGKKSKAYSSVVCKYVHNKIPNVEASFSAGTIEITAGGRNKALLLQEYLASKGLENEKIYVVGDSGNDIDLFKAHYENSFCMSHSQQKVKKFAKYVIDEWTDLENYIFD